MILGVVIAEGLDVKYNHSIVMKQYKVYKS